MKKLKMACGNVNELQVTSINTQGLKSNSEYLSSLLDTNDIIFVCEHWLSNAEKVDMGGPPGF